MPQPSLYPEQILHRRVMTWSLTLRVNPAHVLIKPMSDRWGSCAPDGTITLAADLARLDAPAQDYVIVHELLHLRHRGHGRVFRALLALHIPEWAEIEQRLSTESPSRPMDLRA